MPLSLRKRLPEWRNAIRAAGRNLSWWAMMKALLSGTVPRRVWRERMSVCSKCPIYDQKRHVCWNEKLQAGCKCYCPALAMAAQPYYRGCYAREIGLLTEGWGPYWKP